jgi:nitrate reductase gamma subunit
MARLTSLPSLLAVGSGVLLFVPVLAVLGTWLLEKFRKKSMVTNPEVRVKLARWLNLALFLVHLGMLVWIGFAFSANIFQMLFGFSPQVRGIFAVTAILMGGFALILLAVTVQLWRRGESELRERSFFTAIVILALAYAVTIGVVGL